MAERQMFRQAALDRLEAPEQFDRTLIVNRPKAWLALITLLAMAVTVVAWSIEGEVSTYVKANGIFLHSGGQIVDTVSSGAGTLTRIVPAENEIVTEGAVVAEIFNQEAKERHRSARALLQERRQAVADFRKAVEEEDALVQQNVARQKTRLERLLTSARKSVETARKRRDDNRSLFEEGVVTRTTLERSQQEFDRAEQKLFATMRERDVLEAGELRRRNDYKTRLTEMQSRVQAAQRQVNELESLLETQKVHAPVSGRVTEIKAQPGSILRIGQPVLSIKTGDQVLEVLIYIPPAHDKQVRPGMDALVSPNTLRREEYGAIKGVVKHVSSFPVSLEGVVSTLQNRSLAQGLMEAGAPYSGRVELALDPTTVSGVAWTSPKAANETIGPGTLASIEIKVESQAPITLAVPLLRETLGL